MKKIFIGIGIGVIIFLCTNFSAFLYMNASLLYQAQYYDGAKKIFTLGEKIDSHHSFEYQYNLGNVWYKISTFATGTLKKSGEDNALHHYNQALQSRPNDIFTKENIEFILQQRQKSSTQSGSESKAQEKNNIGDVPQNGSGDRNTGSTNNKQPSSMTGGQTQENNSSDAKGNTGTASTGNISSQEAYELEKKIQELQSTAQDFEGEFGKQQYGNMYISPFETFFQNENNSPERDW